MSFAKKMARKRDLAMRGDEYKARKTIGKAEQTVKMAYRYQMATDMFVRKTALRNLSAVFLYAMHKYEGFGRSRLERLRDKMQNVFECIIGNYVTVPEIADFLSNDIGLDCGLAVDNPKATHHRKIEFRAVPQMSASFLMSMLDEFGYKKKRLGKAYGYCAALSDDIGDKKITYDEITAQMEKVMGKKLPTKKVAAA